MRLYLLIEQLFLSKHIKYLLIFNWHIRYRMKIFFFLILISNVALKAGSSKQGKARRACVGSNWVVASHLEEKRT